MRWKYELASSSMPAAKWISWPPGMPGSGAGPAEPPRAAREVAEAAEAASEHHGQCAWVLTADETVELGVFGPHLSPDARARLGDVAIVAKGRSAFIDPRARNPRLLARHGSLTAAEMHVPLLAV